MDQSDDRNENAEGNQNILRALDSTLSVLQDVKHGVLDSDKLIADPLQPSFGSSETASEPMGRERKVWKAPSRSEQLSAQEIAVARVAKAASIAKKHRDAAVDRNTKIRTANGPESSSIFSANVLIDRLSQQLPELVRPLTPSPARKRKCLDDVPKTGSRVDPNESGSTSNSSELKDGSGSVFTRSTTTWLKNVMKCWEKELFGEKTSSVLAPADEKSDEPPTKLCSTATRSSRRRRQPDGFENGLSGTSNGRSPLHLTNSSNDTTIETGTSPVETAAPSAGIASNGTLALSGSASVAEEVRNKNQYSQRTSLMFCSFFAGREKKEERDRGGKELVLRG